MIKISFENVDLNFPIYGRQEFSLRSSLFQIATGGLIKKESGSLVVSALKNATFNIEEGDAVGLIGHNGAGKSTLLRTMAGIYPPTRGKVERLGQTVGIFDIGAGLEYELTGYENIIQLGLIMGLSLKKARDLIPSIEEFTELGEFLSLPVKTYSSGMIMRLMFGTATAVTPEILLLDEMFSAGDEGFRKKSEDRIHRMIKNAKIFVFATHDIELVKKYCNRFFKIEHGNITEIDYEALA